MGILRPFTPIQPTHFMPPQMPFASSTNPYAVATQEAERIAQDAMKRGGVGSGQTENPNAMGGARNQVVSQVPIGGAPAGAASPSAAGGVPPTTAAAGNGGLMSSISGLFGGSGGGGIDPRMVMQLLGLGI